ncbi:hypothetical protein EVAR_36271_1 [Eumeta japonica]|uniref:Uncharacterized protein n=1 Tax=Eumeta variegata TaxID=151549 RepID=A0A4C1WZL6_EUMVA|nr:hypothetical protein EVAR_36271_1 [Eumeta japonica]
MALLVSSAQNELIKTIKAAVINAHRPPPVSPPFAPAPLLSGSHPPSPLRLYCRDIINPRFEGPFYAQRGSGTGDKSPYLEGQSMANFRESIDGRMDSERQRGGRSSSG